MKYIIYLFTIATLFTGCCCKKNCMKKKDAPTAQAADVKMTDEERRAKLAEEMKKEKVPSESEDYYKMIEKEMPANTAARIQRTACFGRCPIYTLTIFEDGRAEYFGKKFTPREGKYTAAVSKEQIEQLKAKAEEMKFFELNKIYDKEAITDLPSTIVSINGTNGIKTVINRFDGPESLRQFELFFDSLFEGLDWVKVEND